MKYRILGKTGYKVSEVGYGAWSLGADWGTVTDEQASAVLQAAESEKVNFIDTADVYGKGICEKRIANYLQAAKQHFYVATKAGRLLNPHIADGYNKKNLDQFIKSSLQNLQVKKLDLMQLHCPPSAVYYNPTLFADLQSFVDRGLVAAIGVSVEKAEEALKAIEYPAVATVQIIYNMFRQRPAELFFEQAQKRNIGIIVRVPLASGLLTGKYNAASVFPQNDHRNYNIKGDFFDVGETFAGVPLEAAAPAIDEIKQIMPKGFTLAQFAIKWILQNPAVSTVIAGGKTAEQVQENAATSDLPNLSPEVIRDVNKIYQKHIKNLVHHKW